MGREVPVKAGKWTGRGLSGAALKRFAVISMFADQKLTIRSRMSTVRKMTVLKAYMEGRIPRLTSL